MTESREHSTTGVYRSAAYPYLVCGAISLGIVGLAAMRSRADLERAERTLDTARAQIDVVAGAETVADDMRQRIDDLRADLSDYTRLDAGSMTAALATVMNAIPDGVVLEGVTLFEDGEGARAEVAGVAHDQSTLARLRDNLDGAFGTPRIIPGLAPDDADGESFIASFSIGTLVARDGRGGA